MTGRSYTEKDRSSLWLQVCPWLLKLKRLESWAQPTDEETRCICPPIKLTSWVKRRLQMRSGHTLLHCRYGFLSSMVTNPNSCLFDANGDVTVYKRDSLPVFPMLVRAEGRRELDLALLRWGNSEVTNGWGIQHFKSFLFLDSPR